MDIDPKCAEVALICVSSCHLPVLCFSTLTQLPGSHVTFQYRFLVALSRAAGELHASLSCVSLTAVGTMEYLNQSHKVLDSLKQMAKLPLIICFDCFASPAPVSLWNTCWHQRRISTRADPVKQGFLTPWEIHTQFKSHRNVKSESCMRQLHFQRVEKEESNNPAQKVVY